MKRSLIRFMGMGLSILGTMFNRANAVDFSNGVAYESGTTSSSNRVIIRNGYHYVWKAIGAFPSGEYGCYANENLWRACADDSGNQLSGRCDDSGGWCEQPIYDLNFYNVYGNTMEGCYGTNSVNIDTGCSYTGREDFHIDFGSTEGTSYTFLGCQNGYYVVSGEEGGLNSTFTDLSYLSGHCQPCPLPGDVNPSGDALGVMDGYTSDGGGCVYQLTEWAFDNVGAFFSTGHYGNYYYGESSGYVSGIYSNGVVGRVELACATANSVGDNSSYTTNVGIESCRVQLEGSSGELSYVDRVGTFVLPGGCPWQN